jgi:hypothetical protein
MARNPADRYASALAMKDDLDHPDQVQVTGRADRLVAPTVWKGRWVRMRWKLAALAVPVIVFLAFYLARHMKFSWN